MITTGRIGKSWAANYTTTSRLPLHPSLGPPNTDYDPSFSSPVSHSALSFVHGGLAPTYPDLTPYPSKINDISSSLLRKLQIRKFPPVHPPNPYPGLPKTATKEEDRLYGGDGPLWYRGWALDQDEGVKGGLCDRANDVMEKIGVRRLIVGHTPDFEVRGHSFVCSFRNSLTRAENCLPVWRKSDHNRYWSVRPAPSPSIPVVVYNQCHRNLTCVRGSVVCIIHHLQLDSPYSN